jgi:hypothetical protein
MIKTFFFLFLVLMTFSQSKKIAIGGGLYDGKLNTDYAFVAKIWMDSVHSINGTFVLGSSAMLKTDYVWNILKFSDHYDPFYFGFGTLVGLGDFKGIGIETVLGVNVYMYDNSMEAYMELTPTYFIKSEESGVYWQVGLRYYLSK